MPGAAGRAKRPRVRCAGWPSIGESDSLKCLLPDNWAANFVWTERLPFPLGRRPGRRRKSLLRRNRLRGALGARTSVEPIMIAPDYLKRIASWSRDLDDRAIEVARAGIVEKSYRADEFIFMRGDQFEYWTG